MKANKVYLIELVRAHPDPSVTDVKGKEPERGDT